MLFDRFGCCAALLLSQVGNGRSALGCVCAPRVLYIRSLAGTEMGEVMDANLWSWGYTQTVVSFASVYLKLL